jgi:hypothetical protein
MIRCVKLWSGSDGNSHFEEGAIDLGSGPRGDMLTDKLRWPLFVQRYWPLRCHLTV